MESKSKQKSFKKLIFALLFVSIVVSLFAATSIQSSAEEYDDEEDIYFYTDNNGDRWGYYLNSDYTATIDYYGGNANYIVIPSEVDYHEVTTIGEAFYKDDCYSIKIPETVTKIEEAAFFW